MNAPVCPACAASVPAGARFCSSCGARLSPDSAARARFMTVLFCDLAGSTRLTEELGDEAMFGLVTRYQRICNRVTAEHGGYVAKYMGDGMLAYFGYPETMKNSAAAAVAAAHEIIERVAGIDGLGETGADGLSASAGVATGWMVVGDAETGAAAAETMAIGGTVNLAARLQAEAAPGGVAVSEAAGRRLDLAGVALRPLGGRPLRGIAERVEIWLAEPAMRDAVPDAFVGREALAARLSGLWERARTGLVAVEIVAPGGHGKTALARHFLARTVGESDVLELRGERHLRARSYACFRAFLRGLAGIPPTAPPAEQRARIDGWAPPGLAEGLALLLDLDTAPVAPIVRQERIAQSLRGLLAEALPDRPAVLMIEDAHWLDDDSRALIASLPGTMADRPLLVLAARRPEGGALLPAPAEQVGIGRLGEAEAARLVAALDADGRIPGPERAQIVARAGGVPLYLQHIARAVLERPEAGPGIPPTMIEALHERFDHVGDARGLVEAAAILGPELSMDVLAAMLEMPAPELSARLGRLIGRGLFAPGGEGAVAFDHALIRDAVLDTLLSRQRRALHRRALSAYRRTAPERLEARPEIAGHHLLGADEPAEAIPHLVAAADGALMRGEIAQSVRLLREAEGALPGILDAALRDQLETTVRFRLGLALVQHRGFSDAEVAAAYNRALELCLATERGDETEFQIAWGIWAHLTVVGAVEDAARMADRMDAIAAAEPALGVLAASARSVTDWTMGRLAAQEAAAARVAHLYAPTLHRLHALTYSMDSLELALLFRIHGRWIAGDLPGYRAAEAESRAQEAALDLPILTPYIRIYGTGARTYGLPEEAYRAGLEQAVALAAELGQPFWVVAGGVWLARERVRRAGPLAALPDLEAAMAQMRGIGIALGAAHHEALLAQARALAGRADAGEALGRALDALSAGRDAVYAPDVLRLKAEIGLIARPDDHAAARATLDEADRLAGAMGARGWQALIAASRARLMARAEGRGAAETWLAAELARLAPEGSADHPAFRTARRAFSRPI